MPLCLGKKPASKDARDLKAVDFLAFAKEELPEAPVGYGHQGAVTEWGTLGNDSYGDCVWAGAAHETMMWNAAAGRAVSFTAESVLSDYAAVTGFDPKTGANDDGTDVHDAMNYRRQTGVADASGARHKIGAFLALDPGDWKQMLQALDVFEAVGIGIEFPKSAMDQFNAGQPWDVEPGAQIDGGHYIPVVSRPGESLLQVVTWGRLQGMTEKFYTTYCVAPDHRVLTADLRWVPLGDVSQGDELMAFEEEKRSAGGRRYCSSVVTSAEVEVADVYDVELSSGEVFVATADHFWLVLGNHGSARWMSTDRLRPRKKLDGADAKLATSVSRVVPTWEPRTSYEDGWLAGLLDGEGHLKRQTGLAAGVVRTDISFAQNTGPVLDRALEGFTRLGLLGGVSITKKRRRAKSGDTQTLTESACMTVRLKGRTGDRLALLGSLRPTRLLADFSPNTCGRIQIFDSAEVVSVTKRRRKSEIAKVSTTSRTLIVEGYPMHNCDEAYGMVSEEVLLSGGKSPEGLDLAALNDALKSL